MSREATEARLQANSSTRFEADETIVAWCRAWVSKPQPFQRLAGRWRDIVVVTDRRLLLFAVGHFTRRPRRRVLADRLDELTIVDIGAHPGRTLRCEQAGRPPMLLELGTDAWSRKTLQELQARAARSLTSTRATPAPLMPAGGPTPNS